MNTRIYYKTEECMNGVAAVTFTVRRYHGRHWEFTDIIPILYHNGELTW